MMSRSPEACRQLASRARRHVEERRPQFDPDAAEQRRVAGRLVAVNGGTGALMTVGGEVVAAVGVTVASGRITEIDLVVNPDKLDGARRAAAGA